EVQERALHRLLDVLGQAVERAAMVFPLLSRRRAQLGETLLDRGTALLQVVQPVLQLLATAGRGSAGAFDLTAQVGDARVESPEPLLDVAAVVFAGIHRGLVQAQWASTRPRSRTSTAPWPRAARG